MTSEAPPSRYSVDDIVAAGQRTQRRQWVGRVAMGAAGLAAAVVAAGLPFVTTHHAGPGAAPGQQAAGPGQAQFTAAEQPFMYTFKAYDAGAFHVQNPV